MPNWRDDLKEFEAEMKEHPQQAAPAPEFTTEPASVAEKEIKTQRLLPLTQSPKRIQKPSPSQRKIRVQNLLPGELAAKRLPKTLLLHLHKKGKRPLREPDEHTGCFLRSGRSLVRTEFQAPRQQLAERLGMEYDDLVKIVFDSDSGIKASMGEISSEEHWDSVMKRLKRPASELDSIRDEFFAGDILDRTLVDYIRSLRGKYKTGLISNAWGDLRDFIVREKFDDAFDKMIISSEVGAAKPEAERSSKLLWSSLG